MTRVAPEVLDADPTFRQQGCFRVSERGRQVSEQQTIVRFRTDHAAEMVQDSEEAEVEPMGRIRCWHDGSQHGPGERSE